MCNTNGTMDHHGVVVDAAHVMGTAYLASSTVVGSSIVTGFPDSSN